MRTMFVVFARFILTALVQRVNTQETTAVYVSLFSTKNSFGPQLTEGIVSGKCGHNFHMVSY